MPCRAERALFTAGLALALASCAGTPHPQAAGRGHRGGVSDEVVKIGRPYQVKGVTYYPRDDRNYDAVGLASWYGSESGNRTASGEPFYPERISAAHKTLPLPSYVEVTALDTGRTILVRVNDRGPFYPGRIIDLSKGAARALGVVNGPPARVRVRRVEPPEADRAALRAGRMASARPSRGAQRFAPASRPMPVEVPAPPPPPPLPAIEPAPAFTPEPRPPLQLDLPPPEPDAAVPPAPPPDAPAVTLTPLPPSRIAEPDQAIADSWFVQIGAFADRARADSLLPSGDLGGTVAIVPVGGLWRVRVGPFDEAGARAALAQLRARGYQDAVLVRAD